MIDEPHGSSDPECHECPLSRRDLLNRALAGVAIALLADGVAPRVVMALTGHVSAAPRGRKLNRGVIAFPVPAQDGVQFDKDQELILVRNQGHVYAFALSCPHQNTALRWVDEGRFQCPKHKSKYEPDGTFISGRATRNMDRYAIKRGGEEVEVDLEVLYRNDKQPAEWTAAVVVL
jgi:nitrite reductase/ring-hydroxylating ferredoxin subunit